MTSAVGPRGTGLSDTERHPQRGAAPTSEDDEIPAAPNADRRNRQRVARASAVGAVPGVGLYVALLWNNGGFFAGSIFSGFYETQARALRRFRWDVPPGSLGIEAFRVGNKYYEYYGPWPAVLRMPFMALFDGMDGRWTQPSMLLALGIALAATTRLNSHVRKLVRGEGTPLTRTEWWLTALFVAVVASGSVFTFLASQAWVYHEAEIWGASLALASFAALIEYLDRASPTAVVAAAAFATLAILSRPSVGFGPVAATGLAAVAASNQRLRRWAGLGDAFAQFRRRLGLAGATAAPIASYMYVNYAKFQSLFVFPSNRQIFSNVSVYRRAMLARNDNSLFGLKFVPTTLVQYLRPEALRFRRLLPFVEFPRTAPVIGNVLFDTIEPTSSVPTSMPFLTVLALAGIVAVAFASRSSRPRLALVRIFLLGAAAGAATVIPYSYIAQRYMSDFMPLLVVAGLAGLHALLRWSDRRRRTRRAVVAALIATAIWSIVVNLGLGYSYHYETELNPEGRLTTYVEQQYRLYDIFPGGRAPYVVQGERLPYPPLNRGTVFVVGDCAGVYWSQGHSWPPSAKWYAIARTRAVGQFDLRVVFPATRELTIQPLLARGAPGQAQVIAAFIRRRTVSFALWSEGEPQLPKGSRSNRGWIVGPRLRYAPGRSYPVNIVADANNGQISVTMSGYVGFAFLSYKMTTPQLARAVLRTTSIAIGRNDVGAPTTVQRWQGRISERSQPRPGICNYLDIRNARA